jgi:membrane-associated phospholipid phosphatase
MTSRLPPLFAALACASCGTTRSGAYWGEAARLFPAREEALVALREAAADPWTWAPLAGAALFSVGDLDEDVADWAQRETPLFGSRAGAGRASGELRGGAYHAWLVSMAATPSGDELSTWGRNKLQGFAVQWAATTAASELSGELADRVVRERPSGSGDESFPSGHATSAFAYAALARRNVAEIRMPDAARLPIELVLAALPAGAAWARVESGRHFPSDVLFGAALGNFVARLVDGTFLATHGEVRLHAWADPSGGEWRLGLGWSF